jgi:polysaccharide biosynthesis transport protein
MELKDYIRPLLRWWWMLLAASIIAGVSTYFYAKQQPLVYQSRTTLVIGSSVYQANPTGNDLFLGQSLARFYADIAGRQPFRDATMEAIGLTWLPSYVVQPLPNSQLIEIRVNDTNPLRAQVVAAELANQLIGLSPASSADQEQQLFIEEQLKSLEDSIRETKDEIAAKQEELKALVSARQIQDAENDIRALEGKMLTLQNNYANLLANSQRGARNILTLIEPANLPTRPIGANNSMMVLLSAAVGFVLASVAAYLLEYIDDTVKSESEITRITKVPILGYIGELEKSKEQGAHTMQNPRSMISEGFRYLRTNIEIVEAESAAKIILVTSPGISDGKTFAATNLANVIAQGGKKVVLIDADLRRPSVHNQLGIDNSHGLTDLLKGRMDLQQAIQSWNENKAYVISTGELPSNPAELLASKKIDKVLEGLTHIVDVVIIDGPPMIVVDATMLANRADGILLVVRHGHTHRGELAAAIEQLNRANVRILGTIWNRIPAMVNNYYTRYHYYYTVDNGHKKVASKLKVSSKKSNIPEPQRRTTDFFK